MIAILEKTEHNIDFHQIVDFLKASHIRIETMNEEIKILATVDAVDLGEGNSKYQTGYKDKEKELWVELKRLFEPEFEDQLWTHNQAFIHDPLEWKL
nr:hypothetical protein [Tanacetum cinerariifolium]